MTHLSPEQISAWILGESSPDIEQHLQSCGGCHEEVARLQNGLHVFKQSVHGWAEQNATSPIPLRPASPRASWRWAVVGVAAITVALLPLYLDIRQTQRAANTAGDLLLLDQVHQHLARSVPQSMTHLMELMNEREEGPQ